MEGSSLKVIVTVVEQFVGRKCTSLVTAKVKYSAVVNNRDCLKQRPITGGAANQYNTRVPMSAVVFH